MYLSFLPFSDRSAILHHTLEINGSNHQTSVQCSMCAQGHKNALCIHVGYWILSRMYWYMYSSVGGVTVSMVAFQAVDPGSTPGRRTYFLLDGERYCGGVAPRSWMEFPTITTTLSYPSSFSRVKKLPLIAISHLPHSNISEFILVSNLMSV